MTDPDLCSPRKIHVVVCVVTHFMIVWVREDNRIIKGLTKKKKRLGQTREDD